MFLRINKLCLNEEHRSHLLGKTFTFFPNKNMNQNQKANQLKVNEVLLTRNNIVNNGLGLLIV